MLLLFKPGRNGLRDVPTFMLNLTTQWGTILVYFQMPKWVVNFGESLVEAEDDHDSVRALKVSSNCAVTRVCCTPSMTRSHSGTLLSHLRVYVCICVSAF